MNVAVGLIGGVVGEGFGVDFGHGGGGGDRREISQDNLVGWIWVEEPSVVDGLECWQGSFGLVLVVYLKILIKKRELRSSVRVFQGSKRWALWRR